MSTFVGVIESVPVTFINDRPFCLRAVAVNSVFTYGH